MGPLELSTRREVLRALLGVSAAAAGCRRRPTFAYDGAFAADRREVGHAWRDGRLTAGPAAADRSVQVLILGAGASGLVAGWRLRREGISNLEVVDLADGPGGTARGGRSSVSGYPWGAHYLPAPTKDNPRLIELLTDMGVVVDQGGDGAPVFDEAVLCGSPRERVFYKGRWYPGLMPDAAFGPEDRRQMAEFRRLVATWVAFRGADGRRAFTIPVAACSEDPRARRLDELTMAEWLAGHDLTSPLVRAAVDYACRDDFGADPSTVSAWYGLHYFAARTPAPGADSAPFLTWPEGNGRIVDHLVDRIGADRIRLGTLVTGVRPDDGGGWRVQTFDVDAGVRRAYRAKQVVCALPSFLRSRLFPSGLVADYRPTYGSWLVANLHLDGRPAYDGFETAWDNVIFGSRSLGYVVATHQRGSAYGPTVWTWYLPLVGADAGAQRQALDSLTWSEAADLAVAELDRTHRGLAAHLTRVDVRRWGHAMVRPEPGLAFSGDRGRAARSVDGLHFAHSDLSGVALFEEAFHHGDRAAQAVLRAGKTT